jgi:hypothetical protein
LVWNASDCKEKMKVKRYLGAILVSAEIVFSSGPLNAATSALAISGIVREPPKHSGNTLGGWPVGAYTDRRRIPEAHLASGHADQAGLYNLQARNVPSDLEEAWILSDMPSGVADPVHVSLPNPMEAQCTTTADELVVNLKAKALAERDAAVNYASAVIEDESIRAVLGVLAENFEKALIVAKMNLTQRAGRVVVRNIHGNANRRLPTTSFGPRCVAGSKNGTFLGVDGFPRPLRILRMLSRKGR